MFGVRCLPLLRSSLGACGGVTLGSSVLVLGEKEKSDWTAAHAVVPSDGVKLSRKIVSPVDKTGLGLRLYQYQSCPYCSKVRATLDYYGFSYDVVEVNPVTRTQLKAFKGYRKVPVLTSSKLEEPLKESSQIQSILYSFLVLKDRSLENVVEMFPKHEREEGKKTVTSYPNAFFVMREGQKLTEQEMQNAREEREWREWTDNHFIHIISPNVYRTWSEALETFRQFDKNAEWERVFPTWERYLAIYSGAAVMFLVSKKLKKRHGITDERKAMLDACNAWLDAKGPDRKFMGGDLPNLADLSFYGALTSFAGCTAFKEMREQTKIGEWYDSVDEAVQQHRGSALVKARSQQR
ncbi:Microsomal prostaglandin E synthase 2 [Aphelenchoides fujianensis]|nr:Microsomal prostaglandin E synthase 2 [Aphelenchoides fujianensis]